MVNYSKRQELKTHWGSISKNKMDGELVPILVYYPSHTINIVSSFSERFPTKGPLPLSKNSCNIFWTPPMEDLVGYMKDNNKSFTLPVYAAT